MGEEELPIEEQYHTADDGNVVSHFQESFGRPPLIDNNASTISMGGVSFPREAVPSSGEYEGHC
jgi:hypothetical protein